MTINYKILEIQQDIREQRVSHILHLIASFISCGIWLPVWLIVTMSSKIEISRLKRKVKGLCDGEVKA